MKKWYKIDLKGIKKRDIKLDKIYCSAAKRTTKTCKKLCKEIDYDFDKVKFDRELYDNNSGALDYFISYVMELDKKYDKVAIVWHNYILSEFASFLIWEDIRLPTSWVIKIDFWLKKWKDISYQSWKLDYFIYPSLIRK